MKAMDEAKSIKTPLTRKTIDSLSAGDFVLLSGIVYTARDTAHKVLNELIARGDKPPIPLKGQVIYYMGPCPPKPGYVCNSAGPTTSSRMDAFTPLLLKHGLSGMIGKGERSQYVIDAMVKYGAVYFSATGGTAALLSKSIVSMEVVALADLGPEAIYKLELDRMPVFVGIDARGKSLYGNRR